MSEKRLLGYCGMYCGDCLGYTGAIADASTRYLEVLDKYQFERTAVNVFTEELSQYDKFIDILEFMSGLRCNTLCRDLDGGESKCEVRHCAVDSGFYACNECEEYQTCGKLVKVLGSLHVDSCRKNLNGINSIGLRKWLGEGRKHRYWDEG